MQSKSLNTMLEAAKKVMQHSYSPYSKYRVGACLTTDGEHFFSGTNMENACYALGICAESLAIGAMIAAGFKTIKEIVVIGSGKDLCTPCGACRQRIQEFSTPNTLIHLANADGIQKTLTIADLLPYAFGSEHLK